MTTAAEYAYNNAWHIKQEVRALQEQVKAILVALERIESHAELAMGEHATKAKGATMATTREQRNHAAIEAVREAGR